MDAPPMRTARACLHPMVDPMCAVHLQPAQELCANLKTYLPHWHTGNPLLTRQRAQQHRTTTTTGTPTTNAHQRQLQPPQQRHLQHTFTNTPSTMHVYECVQRHARVCLPCMSQWTADAQAHVDGPRHACLWILALHTSFVLSTATPKHKRLPQTSADLRGSCSGLRWGTPTEWLAFSLV